MMQPPEGFSRYELEEGWAVLRDDAAQALLDAGVGRPEALPPSPDALGRRPHPIVDAGGEVGEVVVRQCRRGGAIGWILSDTFRSPRRALRELRVACCARERGAPAPEVLGVVVRPARWGAKRLYVLSRRLAGAVDLRAWIESSPPPSPRVRQAAARRIAQAIARCHNAGLYHADLHVKNVLVRVRGDDAEAFVIDLDRARLYDRVPPRMRLANLARLNRSIEKWPSTRRAIGPRDKLRFFRAYQQECGGLGPGAQTACVRVSWRHRVAWLGLRVAEWWSRLRGRGAPADDSSS